MVSDIPGPGKFEGNNSITVSSMLYSMTLDGFVDDQFGDSTEGPWWEGLILLSDDDGFYIVKEDTQGFFSYQEYDTAEEARIQYQHDLDVYNSMQGGGYY